MRQHFVRNAGEVQARVLVSSICLARARRRHKVLTGPNEIWALLAARVPAAVRLAGYAGEPDRYR
jgi:hypothetical protein